MSDVVGRKGHRPSFSALEHYPKAIHALIQDMWQQKPTARPDMKGVIERLKPLFREYGAWEGVTHAASREKPKP